MGEWGARTLSLAPRAARRRPDAGTGRRVTGGGECEPNAACGLDDASAYFQKFFAQGRELGDGHRMSFGDIVTQIEHQAICGGVQDEPHLIGEEVRSDASWLLCNSIRFSICPRAQQSVS
jgi:hypothetical protein